MKKRILITAKTYPCPSKKYGELVCTTGIDETGKWYRLYPIPFRNLRKEHRYKKYQWIEVDIEKDTADPRSESYKLIGDIAPSTLIDTRNNWYLRKKLILHDVYKNKAQLIYDCRQSDKQISLAIFKPAKIVSFHIETAKYKATECQTYKLPFKFYYKFMDENGISSRLQIIDWEIGELTRKLMRQYKDDFKTIKSILREKYFTDMLKRDIHLFLGTSREWHIRKSPNPFMIIGVFYPPRIVEVILPKEQNLQIENKSFTINQKIIERSYAVQI